MKTIEIMSGDQKVQFTTKSVSFDGKEFLYANMTNVIHSTERHIYTFTYDGDVKLLPYDEKDEKTLNAIFGQVQKLTAQKKAAASAAAGGAKVSDSKANEYKAAEKPLDKKDEGSKAIAEKPSESDKDSQKADKASGSSDKDAPKDASVKVSDIFGKFKSKKSSKKKDEAKSEGKKTEDVKSEGGKGDTAKAEDKPKEDPEKVARRNKSLKTFGIILAILLICSITYYSIFGTPSAPTPANPNSTESQQYDDIDQLIDDLQ